MTLHETDNHSSHAVNAEIGAIPSIVPFIRSNKATHPRKVSCDQASPIFPSSAKKVPPEKLSRDGIKRKHCRRNSVVIKEKLESLLCWEDLNQTPLGNEKSNGSNTTLSLHISMALKIGNSVSSGDGEAKRQKRERS
ncbi:hypothetical protein IV203_022613 [Nitzschia inconspicua]|uniref:Uncharacterized protein n=1 Tax=Nitzschia inconspicua TaxID=303405 RepID=A0A9K3PES3_9STRA|nr:hypothetical protein IV203_022613 [Nitzschia inconspicua]